MTPEQLTKLKDGDIIRNHSGYVYTVLRNTGSVVIAARTLEVTNASEWEHVYTTTPVKAEPEPMPIPASVLMRIEALEGCGWKYSRGYWVAPDGFEEHSLHRAYELRDEHPRMAVRPRVEKCPRQYPGPVIGTSELKDAGWTWVSPNVWRSPSGALHGPWRAWRIMDNAKIAACTAAGARPPVVTFQAARAALRAAGWKNICGRVWRAPSGALFDGTKPAYDAMKKL